MRPSASRFEREGAAGRVPEDFGADSNERNVRWTSADAASRGPLREV
jgi:hypothetical protein